MYKYLTKWRFELKMEFWLCDWCNSFTILNFNDRQDGNLGHIFKMYFILIDKKGIKLSFKEKIGLFCVLKKKPKYMYID